MRLSICKPLENYLQIYSNGSVAPPPPLEPPERTEYDEEDDEEASAAFEPFKDLCKRRFIWYYEAYMVSVEAAAKQVRINESFKMMPFEGHGNGMEGKFGYAEIKRRLQLIRHVLDNETARWALEGLVCVKRETSFAAQLHRHFGQVADHYKKNTMVTVDFELPDPHNPFVWLLTLFGRPMSQLDGGMFKIRMHISPRFPDEQPRVRFDAPLFHHRVAVDGSVCYFPKRPEDLHNHVDSIIEAIEDEHPPYDPRTLVNLEASRLFWGSEADKKTYNRMLRRAVQRTMEE